MDVAEEDLERIGLHEWREVVQDWLKVKGDIVGGGKYS